jgi:AAA15 family ATPase/GTPase
MLLEFSVGNYNSFKEISTLSLVASKRQELSDNNVFDVNKNIKALKSAVIYGANASGKSNFFSAMYFMLDFIKNSYIKTNIDEHIKVATFLLSSTTFNAPSYFEIIFCIGKIIYRYGFEATKTSVIREWLFEQGSPNEKQIFFRENKNISCCDVLLEKIKGISVEMKSNALYLSALYSYGIFIAKKIIKYLDESFIFVDDSIKSNNESLSKNFNNSEELNKQLLTFLRATDLNIKSFKEGKEVFLNYNVYNDKREIVGEIAMSLDNLESKGTKKLFVIVKFIISALLNGKTIIIDEFNNSLHPAVISLVLQSFNSSDINKLNSQIIVGTHDTISMNNKLLRMDQIWFVKKNRYGESELFSLDEFEDVKCEHCFEKNYLLGKYGGIPSVDLENLADIWGLEK